MCPHPHGSENFRIGHWHILQGKLQMAPRPFCVLFSQTGPTLHVAIHALRHVCCRESLLRCTLGSDERKVIMSVDQPCRALCFACLLGSDHPRPLQSKTKEKKTNHKIHNTTTRCNHSLLPSFATSHYSHFVSSLTAKIASTLFSK